MRSESKASWDKAGLEVWETDLRIGQWAGHGHYRNDYKYHAYLSTSDQHGEDQHEQTWVWCVCAKACHLGNSQLTHSLHYPFETTAVWKGSATISMYGDFQEQRQLHTAGIHETLELRNEPMHFRAAVARNPWHWDPAGPTKHSSLRKGGGPRPSLRRARDHVAHGVPIQTPATSPCLMSEMRNCCKCVLVRSCCDPFSMSIATTVKYLPRCLLTALEMPPFPEKSSRKTERLGQNLSQQNGPWYCLSLLRLSR